MAVRTRSSYGAASAVMTVFLLIAGVIALGILLILLGANTHAGIVNFILEIGRFFARPFSHLFPQDTVKQDYLVNWGIAAIVYLVVGSVLARMIRRA